MIISIKHEMIVFWAAFLCGQAVGVIFDFFRAFRKNIHHRSFAVAIEDVAFSIVSFRLFFDICYVTNNGSLRWYIFASFICSITIYFCSVSKYIVVTWSFVLDVLKKIIYPIIKFIQFLSQKLKSVFYIAKQPVNTAVSNIKSFFVNFAKKGSASPNKNNKPYL